MNQRLLISSALASALALGIAGQAAGQAAGQEKPKEKCFGIAKAGQNDCASVSGSHSCAGEAKADGAADDWVYVANGTCAQMKGTSLEEAKKKLVAAKKS